MPASLERCVDKVKGKKGEDSAYAICTAAAKKEIQPTTKSPCQLKKEQEQRGIRDPEATRATNAEIYIPTLAAEPWPGGITGIDNAGANTLRIPTTKFPPDKPAELPFSTEPFPNNPTPDSNRDTTYNFKYYPAAPSENWTHDGSKVNSHPSIHNQEGWHGSVSIPPWQYEPLQSQNLIIPPIIIPPSYSEPSIREVTNRKRKAKQLRESIGTVRNEFDWLSDDYLENAKQLAEKEGGKLYLVRAANATITDHRSEGEQYRRKLSSDELLKMARTAINRGMDINHDPEYRTDAIIFDSEFNPKRNEIQMIVLETDPEIIKLIDNHSITDVSINGGAPRIQALEPCDDNCTDSSCEICNVPKGVILGESDDIGLTWVVTDPKGIYWRGQWIAPATPGIKTTKIEIL